MGDIEAKFGAVLDHKADFLIEKLIKEGILESRTEAEELFLEVKRYLVLNRLYPEAKWQMYSRRIDEVWHQFVLFTREYALFCDKYFGMMLHHSPSNDPMGNAQSVSENVSVVKAAENVPVGNTPDDQAAQFRIFRETYALVFGVPLPKSWFDRLHVSVNRRVVRDTDLGDLQLVRAPDAKVQLLCNERLVLVVTALAEAALAFIAAAKSFFVRELPGGLTDDEKNALVEVLVAKRILMLAP
jgi:hypothetical protein